MADSNRRLACMIAGLLLATAGTSWSKGIPRPVNASRYALGEVPARAPVGFGRADTLDFGYFTTIDGNLYAVPGGRWTWDHGAADPFEGWYATDLTNQGRAYFRQISAAAWAGHNNHVGCPLGNGSGSAWCGAFEDSADTLCWTSGLGYGNNWCQQFFSPPLTYSGTGDVPLSFSYFNDSEATFDYTHVYLTPVTGQPVALNGNGFDGKIGVQDGDNPPPPAYQPYSRTLLATDLGAAPGTYNLYFQFQSELAYSDEDGEYNTAYGPFGVDDIDVNSGQYHYDFEDGLQGWTPRWCPGVGAFFSVQPLSRYTILDPCSCTLAGNVLAFHDQNEKHPLGQDVQAWSPPVRKSLQAPYPTYNVIMAEYQAYAVLPLANGVFYRPGFSYYPWVCPITGRTGWSGRQGDFDSYYVGDRPTCFQERIVATAGGIPANVEDIGFVYEVYYSCEGVFNCTGQTNFTPLVDNVRLRMTGVPDAPVVAFEVGHHYQDNFGHWNQLDVMDVGNADVTFNLHLGEEDRTPDLLGDSLVVDGARPTASTRYNTRLWFRVRREGPGQPHIARYRNWKAKFADFGINFVGETAPNKGRNFVFGWMDSVEVGTRVATNKYCSQFAEFDPHHTVPEQGEDNEIIWDNMLTPGSQIEYLVTSNYYCTPASNFYLPDTSGQNYLSFQILPGYRNISDGRYRFPCVLYVDAADNPGIRALMQNSLNYVINGVPLTDPAGAIPNPTSWDVYHYADAASSWKCPMFRNNPLGGNAGASIDQLLGYEMMIVNTGRNPDGSTSSRDWQGIETWLTTAECFGEHQPRQGFYGSGDELPVIIQDYRPDFLPNFLGATYECGSYNQPGCPPGESENDSLYCVRLKSNACSPWTPAVPAEIFGNWCPAQYTLGVLGVTGSGCGRLSYQKKDDGYVAPGAFASVINDAGGTAGNFRTVIDGYSLHRLIHPDLSQGIPGECAPFDPVRIEQAMADEIGGVLKWTLGISNPGDLAGLCLDPCLDPFPSSAVPSVENARVNRLYPNSPNPFNPRTSIRYSLAADGPAKLVIFDVNGRQVRTLAGGVQQAGFHHVVWDGLDDAGHAVSSGIYWSQLRAGEYFSNRKMVVLK